MTLTFMVFWCIITTLTFILCFILFIYSYYGNNKDCIPYCGLVIYFGFFSLTSWYNLGYFQGQIDHTNNQNYIYLNKNSDNSTEWIYTYGTTQPSK